MNDSALQAKQGCSCPGPQTRANDMRTTCMHCHKTACSLGMRPACSTPLTAQWWVCSFHPAQVRSTKWWGPCAAAPLNDSRNARCARKHEAHPRRPARMHRHTANCKSMHSVDTHRRAARPPCRAATPAATPAAGRFVHWSASAALRATSAAAARGPPAGTRAGRMHAVSTQPSPSTPAPQQPSTPRHATHVCCCTARTDDTPTHTRTHKCMHAAQQHQPAAPQHGVELAEPPGAAPHSGRARVCAQPRHLAPSAAQLHARARSRSRRRSRPPPLRTQPRSSQQQHHPARPPHSAGSSSLLDQACAPSSPHTTPRM